MITISGLAGLALLGSLGCTTPSPANGQAETTPQTPATAAPPAVNTESVKRVAELQGVFNTVAKSAEPAVVTITTLETVPTPRTFRGPSPFGGGPGGGNDPFEDFFRRFFGPDGNLQPNRFVPNDNTSVASASWQPIQQPGTRQRRAGLGSGFIYQADGLIITNAHVVRGASTVTVKLTNGKEYKNAKVLGQDAWTDIAVVKIPANNLPTVPLADSDKVNVGDWAIAVGNPFGLEHTVTVGVISAIGREVPLSDGAPGQYLQTDASINPGNSGGPLLDIYGRVIGVNNAIYSQSGGNVGIGFAIPINTARQIADTLVKDGRVRRARLGIGIAPLEDRASAFGLDPTTQGVLVESVEPNAPAARAGLEPGDIITAYNGQAVTTPSELQTRVAATQVGSNVTIDVLRNGQRRTLRAQVEELRTNNPLTPPQPGDNKGGNNEATSLGLQIAPITPPVAAQLGIPNNIRGVLVTGVQPGSSAEQAGVQRGDIIERVGQTPVTTIQEMQTAVDRILQRQSGDTKSVALYINRRGSRNYVVINP